MFELFEMVKFNIEIKFFGFMKYLYVFVFSFLMIIYLNLFLNLITFRNYF